MVASEPNRERRSIWRVGPESTWTTVLPVLFIIVSLLALALLPVIVSNHTTQVRGEITRIIDPARQAANEVQLDISAELDKVISYQVTGQSEFRDEYLNLLVEQRQLTAVETFSRAHDANEVRSRLYRDLLPATAPAPGQQYAFEVNLDQCSGCKACVSACHSLNGLDDGETWRSVGLLIDAPNAHDAKRRAQRDVPHRTCLAARESTKPRPGSRRGTGEPGETWRPACPAPTVHDRNGSRKTVL